VTRIVSFAASALRLGNPALIVVVLAIGVALLFFRPRAGRRWMVAFFLGFWFVSTPGGSSLLLMPLARGFHPIGDPKEAQSAGAIVVLGGGIRDMKVGAESLAYPHDGTTLRVLETARVFRLLGGRPQVIASGGFTARGRRMTEGAVMADALATLGVPRDHIVVEDQSRNTHEQAIQVTRLLRSRGISKVVLVTAPTHMWRSRAVFRAQNADVVPSTAALFPDDVPKHRVFIPNSDSLEISNEAVHDYAGIIYYWTRGWFRPAAAEAGR